MPSPQLGHDGGAERAALGTDVVADALVWANLADLSHFLITENNGL